MRLILGIVAALLGSILGSATRGAMAIIQARHAGEPEPDVTNIRVSPSAALVGGLLGLVLGRHAAFWVGAMLAAAGSDRVDAVLLNQIGIDMDGLAAKAADAAARR